MNNKPITTRKAAKICNVSHRAVLEWILEGKLIAYRTPGKHSRIREEDLVNFLEKNKMAVPKNLQKDSLKKKVLIIDYEEDIFEGLKEKLMVNGLFNVELNYVKSIVRSKLLKAHPEVVILSLYEDNLRRLEIFKNVKQKTSFESMKIIIISGNLSDRNLKRLWELGINTWLLRPVNIDVLLTKIFN